MDTGKEPATWILVKGVQAVIRLISIRDETSRARGAEARSDQEVQARSSVLGTSS